LKRYLLVEPEFPIPHKSKNHKDFLPIGLLKIARYLEDRGNLVGLVRGTKVSSNQIEWLQYAKPDEVWITSLFTYWAPYVRETVQFYKNKYPISKTVVGGIYASLRPAEEVIKFTGCDAVHQGVIREVEDHAVTHTPSYHLIESINGSSLDYQIIHASRGCPRRCNFCATWKIEPEFKPKKSILHEIVSSKLIFYDNNFLMNPYIENILSEIILLRHKGKIKWIESQSGLDGRVLLQKPHLAKLLRESGFRYPRIAWDWGYEQHESIEKQIEILRNAGFSTKNIFVFMTPLKKRSDKFYPNYTLAKTRDLYYNRGIIPTEP